MTAARDTGPQSALLEDGRRLHLHHGPIDIILEAFGSRREVAAGYWQAQQEFRSVLTGLVEELETLRTPVSAQRITFDGPVAQRMDAAVRPYLHTFVTPMAAVAGAVADHVLAATIKGRTLDRVYANNGGDIALHLALGQQFKIAIAGGEGADTICITADDDARGIATSGWRGRSHSFGIADSVTVLARSAAAADVAATLIANAINLPGCGRIERAPASELSSDSDLGERLVTTGVPELGPEEIDIALAGGCELAEVIVARGDAVAVHLVLQGEMRIVGNLSRMPAVTRPALSGSVNA